MVRLRKFKWTEVKRMEKLAMTTGVKVDTAMYIARVITFDFATNGISVPFFRKKLKVRVAN